jgi:hypothetical protein
MDTPKIKMIQFDLGKVSDLADEILDFLNNRTSDHHEAFTVAAMVAYDLGLQQADRTKKNFESIINAFEIIKNEDE